LRSVAISVLDTGVPEETVELARRIEAVGFGRLWVTEHHTETQSACPSIMAAAVLASTKRLSVTVGGVLARIHSPFFIAEQLKVLAKLYGDRVQFGVVGSMPGDAIRDAIGTPLADTPEEYRQRLLRLRDLALTLPSANPADENVQASRESNDDENHDDGQRADQRQTVGPVGAEPTSFCICGTSDESATFAGELGFPFAFHHFLCPQDRQEDRIAVCQRFRESGGSRLSVAVSGISANSTSEAERLWNESNQGRHTRRPSFLGTAEESAAQIATIVDEMAADEVVIQPLSNDFQTRISTLEGVFHPLKAHFDH
jgi:luciferase family oxidoreductase group 1